MSDSNIYMAFSAVCLLSVERSFRREREEVRGKSRGRRNWTEGGFCSKTEGGVLVMPSVLLTTSGLDGVLRPVHLERRKKKKYNKSLSDLLSFVTRQIITTQETTRLLMHCELTFDCADQKTALVRQVVNHLEMKKKTVKCGGSSHVNL